MTIAVFHSIAAILAIRLTLLLSVVGGFILAVIAMKQPDPWSVSILAAYCTLVVIPLVALYFGKRGA